MIKKIGEPEIKGLNSLPPDEWSYDYETLLKNYIREDFFHAFVMYAENKIVGTGNVFVKGKIGWLANIIVDINFRGRGFGSEMTKFLIDFLQDKGCETQLLIATQLGESVYGKLGFKTASTYYGFVSEFDSEYEYSKRIRPLEMSDFENICALDREINSEDREHFLVKNYRTGLGYFDENDDLTGFYLPDFGHGLVLSKNVIAGIELLQIKHSKKGSRTYIPKENQAAMDFFTSNSQIKEAGKFTRMVLGKANPWSPSSIYSYASGYSG